MAGIVTRFAEKDDRARLIEFLREHWRSDHIFVQAPDMFDWQYANPDGSYNIAIAEDEERLLGFLGFIPTGRYDPKFSNTEIMLAVWKVDDTQAPPGLGLRLLKLIQAKFQPNIIGAIGISDMVEPIYRAFKYRVDRLNHLALFNPDFRDLTKVAQNVPESAFDVVPDSDGWELRALNDDDAHLVDDLKPGFGLQKSWDYLSNRYSQHPWYRYEVQGLFHHDNLKAVIVWRMVEACKHRILRIVDVIGETHVLSEAPDLLRAALVGCEYIDLVQYGMDLDRMRAAGFVSPVWHEELILPNYFAPFMAQNIDVKLAYRCFDDPSRRLTLFRADSDQDRPNQMCELTP